MGRFSRRSCMGILPIFSSSQVLDQLTCTIATTTCLYRTDYKGRPARSNRKACRSNRRSIYHSPRTETSLHIVRHRDHRLCSQQNFLRHNSFENRDSGMDEGSFMVHHHHHECDHVALCGLLSGPVQTSGCSLEYEAHGYS